MPTQNYTIKWHNKTNLPLTINCTEGLTFNSAPIAPEIDSPVQTFAIVDYTQIKMKFTSPNGETATSVVTWKLLEGNVLISQSINDGPGIVLGIVHATTTGFWMNVERSLNNRGILIVGTIDIDEDSKLAQLSA